MKKILYSVCILLAVSCTKFDDALYDSSPIAKQSIGPVYKELADLIDDNGWWFWAQEVSSDEVVFPVRGTDWNDGGKWRVLHQHAWTNDVDAVNSMWSHLFDGVREANKLLDVLSDQQGDPLVEVDIAKIKTLRAFFMYLAMDNYGDIPIITSFVNAPPLPFKAERKEVYEFLINDLKPIVSLLPISTNKFAVSRGMAYSLMAKLYLNAEVYTGTPAYSEAEAMCDSVIGLGTYVLQNDVTSAFAADNVNVPENIFTLAFDAFDLTGFRLHMRTLHYLHDATFNMKVGPWNGFAILKDHYDNYEDDDLRKNDWFIVGQQKDVNGTDLFDETAGTKLVIDPYIPKLVMDASNTPNEIRNSGARVKKYEIESGALENLNNDFPLFRYADILLMKAECAVRNGSPGDGDEWFNLIRQRANISAIAGANLDDILEERGRELFCEGHRRQDLIRFGKFGDAWWEKSPSGPDKTTFPIPQWAIDANPNLGL